jgi:hypothetical protein
MNVLGDDFWKVGKTARINHFIIIMKRKGKEKKKKKRKKNYIYFQPWETTFKLNTFVQPFFFCIVKVNNIQKRFFRVQLIRIIHG